MTKEQQEALDAYWAATSPGEERIVYATMVMLGLPDSYEAYCEVLSDEINAYLD